MQTSTKGERTRATHGDWDFRSRIYAMVGQLVAERKPAPHFIGSHLPQTRTTRRQHRAAPVAAIQTAYRALRISCFVMLANSAADRQVRGDVVVALVGFCFVVFEQLLRGISVEKLLWCAGLPRMFLRSLSRSMTTTSLARSSSCCGPSRASRAGSGEEREQGHQGQLCRFLHVAARG